MKISGFKDTIDWYDNNADKYSASTRNKTFAANAKDFLANYIAALIIDLPNLIMAEKEYQEKQSNVVRFRVSTEDKARIEEKAVQASFKSVSDYLRHLALA